MKWLWRDPFWALCGCGLLSPFFAQRRACLPRIYYNKSAIKICAKEPDKCAVFRKRRFLHERVRHVWLHFLDLKIAIRGREGMINNTVPWLPAWCLIMRHEWQKLDQRREPFPQYYLIWHIGRELRPIRRTCLFLAELSLIVLKKYLVNQNVEMILVALFGF